MEDGLEDSTFIVQSNYRIANCPEMGRHLIATRHIKKGEIILNDQPLAMGPIKTSERICPGCYQSTLESKCDMCGWPICSKTCPTLKSHQQLECTLLQSRKHLHHDWTDLADLLMIIRCLLLKITEPRKFRRLLEMETNWDQWCRSPHHTSAVDLEYHLRQKYFLSPEDFPSSDILRVQAILDINAYEVRLPDSNIQAVYQLASLAEHSCIPNAHRTICNETFELTLRAATEIPQGTHISTTYCDILWPTWHRQQYLQWSKFFTCSCPRCLSPSELDAHLSSILCMDSSHRQRPAAALPLVQGDWTSLLKDYQCTVCLTKVPSAECQLISKKATDELAHLDKFAQLETIPMFEAWLNKWTLVEQLSSSPSEECGERQGNDDDDQTEISKPMKTDTCYASSSNLLLHPQHSLVLDCCHTLFLLYPKEDSTLEQLRRKERVGQHLLQATNKLFTGISKFRGTISYELAMTKAAILVHQLETSGVTDHLQHLAEEVIQLLEESQEMLKYEPRYQPEGQLAQTGASQLEQLNLFFAEIFPKLNLN